MSASDRSRERASHYGTATDATSGTVVGATVGGIPETAVGGAVGTLVGSAVGAVAGGLTGAGIATGINPVVEDAYWRETYRSRPYVDPGRSYDDYQPAYRFGWESRARYAGRSWQEVAYDLERGWEDAKGHSRLTWNEARHAVREAWERVGSQSAVPEDAYWREYYRTRPYAESGRDYEHYQPAYKYGWESRERYADRTWDQAENDLERGWENAKGASRQTWNEAKHATRDAWNRVGHEVASEPAGLGSYGTSATSPDDFGEGVPPPKPPRVRTLRRTPHMDIVPQRPLAAGDSLLVIVYADDEPAHDGEKVSDISIDAPAAIQRFNIEVFLSPSGHFRIEGPDVQTLVLDRDRRRSELVSFSLRVVDDPTVAAGRPEIRAYFGYGHRPCGMVSREVTIRGVETSAPASDRLDALLPQSDGIETEIDAIDADLQVVIYEASALDGRTFTARVSTPLLPARREWQTQPWVLPQQTAAIVDGYMANFTSSSLDNKDRLLELRGAGKQLFETAPEIFKRIFWELIDAASPLRTISIVSAEPNIPWELMVPWRRGQPERSPLGVEFNVGRWATRKNFSPGQRLQLKNSVVVAPRDPKLEKAEDEVKIVLDRFPGKRIDPALVESLDAWLQKEDTTLLHFICHGTRAEVSQELKLEGGRALNATRLLALEGVRRALGKARPLVFLNACDAGRTVPSLVGPGGLAKVFITLGAAGVVAPLWSVRDTIAHQIAEEFYLRVKAEPETPFAAILRSIRKKAYEAGEDTFAAYCFYGDPKATAAGA